MAGYTYQQLQDTLHAGVAPGRQAALTVGPPPPKLSPGQQLQSQLRSGQINKQQFIDQFAKLPGNSTKAGFFQRYSTSNLAGALGRAAKKTAGEVGDVGVSTARFPFRSVAGLEATAQQGITGRPTSYTAKDAFGRLLLGSGPVQSAQVRGAGAAAAHPGGFKVGPLRLSSAATGAAETGISFLSDVTGANVVKGLPRAVEQATAKNSLLGRAITKAKAAKDAGVPLPPSAIDKHLQALPKETPLPSPKIASGSAPTPVAATTRTAGKGESGKVLTPVEGSKVSGVAKGVEARAIEKKLAPTTGYDELATFNPKTHAAENAKVADLVSSDPQKAISIAKGAERLPNDIHGGKLLNALEIHAHNLSNPDESAALLKSLAKSPLATEVSETGQKLGLSAGKDPNSAVAHIQSILDARAKAASAKLGSVPKAVSATAREIKTAVTPPSKQDWSQFIESIKC